MIRATFLIEHSGQQLSCMLNPSDLVFRRTAGLGRRPSVRGPFTGGPTATDEPLLFTGGGVTELDLDLLFDVTIEGSTIRTEDVRDLTRPLWQLAENALTEVGVARPPLVRFVWGKAWNFPGVVAAIAERFDLFQSTGVPQRSWLRMKMKRVDDRDMPGKLPAQPDDLLPELPADTAPDGLPTLGDFPLPGEGYDPQRLEGYDGAYVRFDLLAFLRNGDPATWRQEAAARGVIDPLRVPADLLLDDTDDEAPADAGEAVS